MFDLFISERNLKIRLKSDFTAQREVHAGGPEYNAVLLIDGHFTVGSQVVETALTDTQPLLTNVQHKHTAAHHINILK